MTSCQEVCDAASHCAPCALDAELDRIALGRIPAYVEGSNRDGTVWAELHGRPLHGTARDDD